MTYLSLDVWGPHRWNSRRVALGRHPVAEIHSTPCAVRCLNARRNQRHKIQSSTRPARSSWRTGWRGALPLLPRRFIHQELPSCVESRVKRWRQHRRDPATEVSRGPRITQKSFVLAISNRVLPNDSVDASLRVKYASMASWKRSAKATHTRMFLLPFTANAHLVRHKTGTMEGSSAQETVLITSVWIRPKCE